MTGPNRNLVDARAVQHLLDFLRPADVSLHEELVVDVRRFAFQLVDHHTTDRLHVSFAPRFRELIQKRNTLVGIVERSLKKG